MLLPFHAIVPRLSNLCLHSLRVSYILDLEIVCESPTRRLSVRCRVFRIFGLDGPDQLAAGNDRDGPNTSGLASGVITVPDFFIVLGLGAGVAATRINLATAKPFSSAAQKMSGSGVVRAAILLKVLCEKAALECRYAATRGTFPLASRIWEEGDVHDQGSTRDSAQVADTSTRRRDRIFEANNTSVVGADEARLDRPERDKIVLSEKIESAAPQKGRLEDCIELALKFLSSPWNIYENGDFTMRQTVLRLAFSEPLRYSQNCMHRAPGLSFSFRYLEGIPGSKSEMVL